MSRERELLKKALSILPCVSLDVITDSKYEEIQLLMTEIESEIVKSLPEPVGVVRAITPIARTAEFNFNTDLNGNIPKWLKEGAKVYAEPTANKREESYSDALRSLASYVGCGGYNADDPIDAKEFEEKIRLGIDLLLSAQSQPCVRKPMSDDEIESVYSEIQWRGRAAFFAGVRFAEDKHGIKER